MSTNNKKNIINDNNLTIDNTDINSQKSKISLKKIIPDESRKNTIQSEDYINNNLPSIMKQKETENEENGNNFHSERGQNNENKSIKIIDERQKNLIESVKRRFSYKIIYIYKNEDHYITIKPNCKVSDIKDIISKEINLDNDKIILIYKDKEMDDIKRNVPVNKIINFSKLKSRPIIYVKKKYINNNSLNSLDIYKFNILNYENKIKILNYPTMSNSNLSVDEDLFNIVSDFCKNNSITSAFQIEKNDDNPDLIYHIISFASSDIVFDFNRYFTSLKIGNPIFKDTKTVKILSRRKVKNIVNNSVDSKKIRKRSNNEIYEQKKKNGEMKRNLLNMNINRYISNSGPYITPYDQFKNDEKENKKKWLNPKGFISSVNKYSGIKW